MRLALFRLPDFGVRRRFAQNATANMRNTLVHAPMVDLDRDCGARMTAPQGLVISTALTAPEAGVITHKPTG